MKETDKLKSTNDKKVPFLKRLKNIFKSKGMFSRIIVIFCLVYCVRIVEWSMDRFEETNMEAPTLITVALGLFGGELLLLCLKRIFAKSDKTSIRKVEEEINNVSASTSSYDIYDVPIYDSTNNSVG